MSRTRRDVAVVITVVLVLALGIMLGRLLRSGTSPQAPDTNQAVPGLEPTNRPYLFPKQPGPRPRMAVRHADTDTLAESTSAVESNAITDWEEKLEEVLRADVDPATLSRLLLDLLPHIPESGQVGAVRYLANVLDDADYEPLAKMFANPATPEEVLEVLMTDLLNRPNGLKLPLLLTVARQSNHPIAGVAKELLELHLGEDFGADWARWETALQDWLAGNPD